MKGRRPGLGAGFERAILAKAGTFIFTVGEFEPGLRQEVHERALVGWDQQRLLVIVDRAEAALAGTAHGDNLGSG